MKSTVFPNPLVVVSVFFISVALVVGYITGRVQGNKEIKALEAQYAEEDKASAESVDKLVADLKAQCDEQIQYIVNNKQGGS